MSFLKDHISEINILFDMIRVHVKEKFDVDIDSLDALKNKSRKKHLVYFRRTLMVILGETFINSEYTQEDISSVVGLDRTSFIHHSKTHLNEYTRYNSYKQEYDSIRNEFLQKIGKDYAK
jgi:hypothetical protein